MAYGKGYEHPKNEGKVAFKERLGPGQTNGSFTWKHEEGGVWKMGPESRVVYRQGSLSSSYFHGNIPMLKDFPHPPPPLPPNQTKVDLQEGRSQFYELPISCT